MQACQLSLPRRVWLAPRSCGARSRVATRVFFEEPEFEDTPGVGSLLDRDRRNLELKEEAFSAFEDSPAAPAATAAPAPAPAAAPRPIPSARAAAAAASAGAPQRSREAIDLGLALFQQKKYREAIEAFQLSLELPGSGLMRMSGSVREYSCPSDGEESAALYNMACAYAVLGEKPAALTVLEALLDAGFDQYDAVRQDPDLAPLRGPELEKLIAKHDGLVAKLFGGGKKQQQSERKPWLQW